MILISSLRASCERGFRLYILNMPSEDGPGLGSHSRLFSGLIVIGTVLLASGVLSDPVLFDTVVQHWLLATNHDCIAVGLSLSLHPCSKID